MKIFNNDNKLNIYKENKELKISQDKIVKTCKLVAEIPLDSTYETTGIKIGQDNTIEMNLGDDLGIIVHLLPHHYNRTNIHKLTTSNKNIVDINDMVLTAKSIGTCQITATTLDNKFSDTITVNVVEKENFIPIKELNLNPDDFNFIENDYSYKSSTQNSIAFSAMIEYAKENNIEKIIFPKNKQYYLDPADPISLKNNLVIDFNGSKIITAPNPYKAYTLFLVEESQKSYNIAYDLEWQNSNGQIFECMPNYQYKQLNWVDENGNSRTTYGLYDRYSYNLKYTTGNEDGIAYLNKGIQIKKSTNEKIENYIIPNQTYNFSLTFTKCGNVDDTSIVYIDNTIKVIAELYKNGVLQSEKTITSINWTKWNRTQKINLTSNFIITEDADEMKIKVIGLSDTIPLTVILSKVQIRKVISASSKVENIYFKNGSLLGERYTYEEDGVTEIKDTLFNKYWGKTWKNSPEIEGSLAISIYKGRNIELDNMEISNSVGFNIGIDTTGNQAYYSTKYPNANNIEFGKFDKNGQPLDVDDESYARFTEYVEIDLSKSQYFVVTDPTFASVHYYGYRSRIIDIYCYDENKQCLAALESKLRHGIMKAPEGTKYIKIAVPLVPTEGLITTGNSDFGNCIFAIKSIYETKNIIIKNCKIANNYSCGIAMSGAYILVEDCVFENNIGRMPWCDIDCEDGWQRMQSNVFRRNKFSSYYGLIMCAGINFVFKENEIKSLTLYDQCMHFKVVKNNFIIGGYGRAFDGNQDHYILNNSFVTIHESTYLVINGGKSTVEYNNYFENNYFNDKTVRLNSNCSFRNNYFNCENIEINGVNTQLSDGVATEFLNKYAPNLTKISFVKPEISPKNCDYSSVKNLACLSDQTFNSCIFRSIPTNNYNSKNYTLTFNNCTIFNPFESDYYIFNDCNLIYGVDNSLVYENVITDNLIFTLQNAKGDSYQTFNEHVCNFDKDFTIQLLIYRKNMDANRAINFLQDRTIIHDNDPTKLVDQTVSSYWNYDGVQYNGYVFDNNGNTERIFKYPTTDKKLGNPQFYTIEFLYDSQSKNLSTFVNGSIADISYTPPEGFNFKFTNPKLTCSGNVIIDVLYLYGRLLSEEERVNNSKALINGIQNKLQQ